MKNIRTSISKKTRFEVFKRDNFCCQYCGNTPPKVILEVDHIIPACCGGNNSIDNLTTSCFECNRGKGGEKLTVLPETIEEKSAILKEKQEQLKKYESFLQEIDDDLDKKTWKIIKELSLIRDNTTQKVYYSSIKKFIRLLGYFECLDATEITSIKCINSDSQRFRYFCGICWNKKSEKDNG